jgi:hypothetical protein
MELVRIQYTGSKPYRDKTKLRNTWATGQSRLVPDEIAKPLLRFAEFSLSASEEEPGDRELAEALAQVQVVQETEKQKLNELETMLLTLESWDKNQLEEYAKKYDVAIDKRRAVAVLRQEVGNLLEQFGVR